MKLGRPPGLIRLLVSTLWLIGGVALTAQCSQKAEPGQKRAVSFEKARDDLFSLSFPSEAEGWACGRHGTILHTRDGGLTWEKQESPVESFHMRVVFPTSLRGFIASERTHLLATEDGGEHWTVRFQDEDLILKSVSFGDPIHGWAVGEFGGIYSTADGGEHWAKQAGTYEIDSETGDLKGDALLFDVVAIDRQTAWAVGIRGTVKMTADGGGTWRKVDVGVEAEPLFCIAHDGADTLMIAGKGICLRSSDRGRTWTRIDFVPPLRYGWVHHIARLGSAGLAVACGEAGGIYRKSVEGIWSRVAY